MLALAALVIAFRARLIAAGQVGALARAAAIEGLRLRGRVAEGLLLRLAFAHCRLLALSEAVVLGFHLGLAAFVALREILQRALIGEDEAVVMVRMLVVVLRHDAVAGRGGIARKHQIFLINLVSGATQAHTRAVAVEGLIAALVVVLVLVMARLAIILASAPSTHDLTLCN